MSRDRIVLNGLRVRGFHGVFDFERREGQDFLVDVVLFRDLAVPAASDDLADTADYGELAGSLVEIVAGESFDLIEALAGALMDACLVHAPEAQVTVHKPQAPISHEFADVSVTLRRSREGAAGEGAARECVPGEDVPGEGAAAAAQTAPAAAQAEAAQTGRADAAAAEYEAVIALGANLGEAREALQDAVRALSLHPRICVLAGSRIFVTAPVGGVAQPDFHNAAVTVRTSLPPRELLAVCQGIEVAAGRTREVRWGPRTLDLDLISMGRIVPGRGAGRVETTVPLRWADEVLSLPHPLAGERAFVLAPWAQLQPEAIVDTPQGPQTVAAALSGAADAGGIREIEDGVIVVGLPPETRRSARAARPEEAGSPGRVGPSDRAGSTDETGSPEQTGPPQGSSG